jgi:tetratricopeptide (TPR) repeat protein
MKKIMCLAVTLIGLAGCAHTQKEAVSPGAHSGMAMGTETALDAPIDLIPAATGAHTWAITTADDQAQAYFNQGIQLRYGFNVDESARSMAAARRLDPQCAMCYWGEALAMGSYLNGGMSKSSAVLAHAAITQAVALAGNASAMERALIMAAQTRYPANYEPAQRRISDTAFAEAMAEVYANYPDHHEVATIYAVALFMLEDRRGYRDLASADLQRLHGVLTRVLAQDITHPGACHLYIHATESSQDPGLALGCAEHLSQAIPIASHVQHMPSHTFNEVGLWGRSVRANTKAVHSDLKAAQNLGFSYGPGHNLHMLLYAASYDGQGAVATQAGKDYRKIGGNAVFEVLTLLRFGRFDEILENQRRPEKAISAAMWEFSQGYASLKQGDMQTATTLRDQVLAFAATSNASFRRHPARHLVGTLAHILAGEILLSQGETSAAVQAFVKAVEFEDEMQFDEPEPLPFSARHWLGAALLEAGQPAQAELVYQAELLDHPHNGWSLVGLRTARLAQGLPVTAVDEDLAESWARSDAWIQASKF